MQQLPSILEAFAQQVACAPDSPGFFFCDSPGMAITSLSYLRMYQMVSRAVAGFRDQQIEPETRLLIALPTSGLCISLYLAALASNVVPIMAPAPSDAQINGQGFVQLKNVASQLRATTMILPRSFCNNTSNDPHTKVLSCDIFDTSSSQGAVVSCGL